MEVVGSPDKGPFEKTTTSHFWNFQEEDSLFWFGGFTVVSVIGEEEKGWPSSGWSPRESRQNICELLGWGWTWQIEHLCSFFPCRRNYLRRWEESLKKCKLTLQGTYFFFRPQAILLLCALLAIIFTQISSSEYWRYSWIIKISLAGCQGAVDFIRIDPKCTKPQTWLSWTLEFFELWLELSWNCNCAFRDALPKAYIMV